MDDPDDPVVTEDKVPSFGIVDQIIKSIDNTIIVYRIYYLFTSFIFRFQLIKKDRMCIIEIPRSMLEKAGRDGTDAENELTRLVTGRIEDADCWTEFQG